MEDISRKQLGRISQLLQNHINSEESIKLANMLENADVIPKLYAYTYFKKIREEMQTYKVFSKEFDLEEFETLNENLPALQLDSLRNKREVRAVFQILNNGFEREKQFCDFDDSRFHNKTMIGSCNHEDNEQELEEVETKNENLVLSAVYMPDEDTAKYEDEPEWWCKKCSEDLDGDSDVIVTCDSEMEI